MDDRYNQLLDNVYELEGLLQLAMSRENVPEALPRLIRNKALVIAALADEPDSDFPGQADDASPDEEAPTMSEDYEAMGEEAPAMSEEAPAAGHLYGVTDADRPDDRRQPDMRDSESTAAKRATPVFSINDRYLFIRELFKSDGKAFDKAMEMLPRMDQYEEAEAYFYDELGFEPEQRNVIRFMSIISAYFKQ